MLWKEVEIAHISIYKIYICCGKWELEHTSVFIFPLYIRDDVSVFIFPLLLYLPYPNCTRELFSYAVMRTNKIHIQVSFYNIMQTRKTKIGNLFKIMQTINKIFLGETHLELPQKFANWTSCLLLSIKKLEKMYFV